MQAQVVQGQGGNVVVQVPQAPDAPIVVRGGSPRSMYEAMRNQRSELRDQLEELEDQRSAITRQLNTTEMSQTAIRSGLETRLAQLDQRIVALDKQIAESDAAVARAASIPGAVPPPTPPPRRSGPPEEFWVISGLILVPSAFILTVAYARRIWRRGAQIVSAIPQEVYDRFTRVEQALDSVAVEVERIGEGQRYLTRVLAERQIGAGAAQPVETRQREAQPERQQR